MGISVFGMWMWSVPPIGRGSSSFGTPLESPAVRISAQHAGLKIPETAFFQHRMRDGFWPIDWCRLIAVTPEWGANT